MLLPGPQREAAYNIRPQPYLHQGSVRLTAVSWLSFYQRHGSVFQQMLLAVTFLKWSKTRDKGTVLIVSLFLLKLESYVAVRSLVTILGEPSNYPSFVPFGLQPLLPRTASVGCLQLDHSTGYGRIFKLGTIAYSSVALSIDRVKKSRHPIFTRGRAQRLPTPQADQLRNSGLDVI